MLGVERWVLLQSVFAREVLMTRHYECALSTKDESVPHGRLIVKVERVGRVSDNEAAEFISSIAERLFGFGLVKKT